MDRNIFHIKGETFIIYEKKFVYDDNNRLIQTLDACGEVHNYKYDENGRKIYTEFIKEDGSVSEEWWEYDENGREIYWKNSIGAERCRTYDERGNMTSYRESHVKGSGFLPAWVYKGDDNI